MREYERNRERKANSEIRGMCGDNYCEREGSIWAFLCTKNIKQHIMTFRIKEFEERGGCEDEREPSRIQMIISTRDFKDLLKYNRKFEAKNDHQNIRRDEYDDNEDEREFNLHHRVLLTRRTRR